MTGIREAKREATPGRGGLLFLVQPKRPSGDRESLRFGVILLMIAVAGGCQFSAADTEGDSGPDAGVYTGPMIDMHVHAFTAAEESFFGTEHPPTLRGETYPGVATPEEQRDMTLERLRANNVVKAMVSGGELWYDLASDMILVGGGFQPIEELRRQFDAGRLQVLGELAPFYQGLLADDQALAPYFALADELGIPVGFHILPGGPNGAPYLGPAFLQGVRAYNADPLQLEDVLVRHPDVKVYVMHAGWPYLEDMKALMYAHPQVYVDIAVINWILPKAEFHAYLEQLVQAGFGDRIMFGSDQMTWPQTIDVAVDAVNSAPFLSMEQKAAIFYDNAAAFLGLDPEEIEAHKAGS